MPAAYISSLRHFLYVSSLYQEVSSSFSQNFNFFPLSLLLSHLSISSLHRWLLVFSPFFSQPPTLPVLYLLSPQRHGILFCISLIQTTREVLDFFFLKHFSCSCSMNGNDESISVHLHDISFEGLPKLFKGGDSQWL